jgi:hypothetical protein
MWTYIHTYIYIYIYMLVCLHVISYVCIYVCMYVCMYVAIELILRGGVRAWSAEGGLGGQTFCLPLYMHAVLITWGETWTHSRKLGCSWRKCVWTYRYRNVGANYTSSCKLCIYTKLCRKMQKEDLNTTYTGILAPCRWFPYFSCIYTYIYFRTLQCVNLRAGVCRYIVLFM